MTLHIPFDNSYAQLPAPFFTRIAPKPVATPQMIAFNDTLAEELSITPGDPDTMALAFSGNEPPKGADPLAQAYAGHQFGGFSPQLGDGRANLLGEVVDRAGNRRDIQLKGSGPTPYSRMGDGRAWLGPVLREYVVSEAMHAMGVPTTRALAAVSTGEPVFRQEGALPGAVLTRVASSHIRVGTFQYFYARRDLDSLRALLDYALKRHVPRGQTPGDLLEHVIDAQARLVVQWESLGFIHGVMNTDNTTISGETIDYGPCAFMDAYNPDQVYSSIDAHGRYAYSNQRKIIVWNMAQLATCLVPLCEDQDAAVDDFTQAVHAMPERIDAYWLTAFGRKIGLADATEADRVLIDDLLGLMAEAGADFTNTFRGLADGTARDQFADTHAFDTWAARWQAKGPDNDLTAATNPWIIPRNHQIEALINAGVQSDFDPFQRLLDATATPYGAPPENVDLTAPPEPDEVVQATFCGT